MSDLRAVLLVALPAVHRVLRNGGPLDPVSHRPVHECDHAATIGNTGSPILEDYADLSEPGRYAVFGWVVDSPRGPVSQYPPGTALLAAPLYAMSDDPAPGSTHSHTTTPKPSRSN